MTRAIYQESRLFAGSGIGITINYRAGRMLTVSIKPAWVLYIKYGFSIRVNHLFNNHLYLKIQKI